MKHDIEFIEDGHLYLVDGVITPSITQLLKHKFGGMYDFVNPNTLDVYKRQGHRDRLCGQDAKGTRS